MSRWVVVLTAGAFAIGVGLGAWLMGKWRQPVVPSWPVWPSQTPAPPTASVAPVLAAQAGTVTRVTIRRPVAPPVASSGPGLGERVDPTLPATGGLANPGFEEIEVVVAASAAAAVTPATPDPSPAPGPWGLVVGTQPGLVGLGYEAVTWHGVGGLPVRVGVAGVLTPQAVGVGGNLGLEAGLPRLYWTAGAAQRFGQPFDPAPFVGLGWRL